MGLDLHALEKLPSFSDAELEQVILLKKQMDYNVKLFDAFVDKIAQEQYQKRPEEFWLPENQTEVEAVLELPEVKSMSEALGIDRYYKELSEGRTSSVVLNYYFKHCDDTYWYDVPLVLNRELMEQVNAEDAVNPVQVPLSDLLDENQLLHPAHVAEAIQRIKSRRPLREKDLRIIAFLEKFKSNECMFAFL